MIDQEGNDLVEPLLRDILLHNSELDATSQATTAFSSKLTPPIIFIKNSLQLSPAVDEISSYLKASFGDRTRIDYGSGHELNFLCFLYCLYRLGYIVPTDSRDVVLVVFTRSVFIAFCLICR